MLIASCAVLLLVSCGGGGESEVGPSVAEQVSVDDSVLSARIAASSLSDLKPTPVVRVNTTTAGTQAFRSIWPLNSGGHAVVWVSEGNYYVQSYDSSNRTKGPEIKLALGSYMLNGSLTEPAVAILLNGDSVIAYRQGDNTREVGPGVFFKRFNAQGEQVTPETTVIEQIPYPDNEYAYVTALRDGAFLVGYAGARGTLASHRYDSDGNKVGEVAWAGSFNNYSYSTLVPDLYGGHVTRAADDWVFARRSGQAGASFVLMRFDETNAPKLYLTFDQYSVGEDLLMGPAALLPLENEKYIVLLNKFGARDSTGVRPYLGSFSQVFDKNGKPDGNPIQISAAGAEQLLPAEIKELADGTYVVLFEAQTHGRLQRYRQDGTPIGEGIDVPKGIDFTPLDSGGFALAASSSYANGDLDVYTWQYAAVLDHKNTARRAARQACKEHAKTFRGWERWKSMKRCYI